MNWYHLSGFYSLKAVAIAVSAISGKMVAILGSLETFLQCDDRFKSLMLYCGMCRTK